VMDRGFGKMDRVEEVVKKNFKLITVAATLGSQHPFVPTSAMQSYQDKLKQKKKPEELNYFNHYIEKWEVKDDAKVLRGPELFGAINKSNPDLHALLQSCCQLCMGQCTADWFTLRTFHLTATMASQVLGGSYNGKNDGKVLTALLKSWFNRPRSTTNMVIGTKNEDAVLMAFSKLPHVLHIWSVGLLENKHYNSTYARAHWYCRT